MAEFDAARDKCGVLAFRLDTFGQDSAAQRLQLLRRLFDRVDEWVAAVGVADHRDAQFDDSRAQDFGGTQIGKTTAGVIERGMQLELMQAVDGAA